MSTTSLESAQHIGQRSQQQDAVRTVETVPGFAPGTVAAVVADGMGGMVGGAEASRVAVEAFSAALARRTPTESPADVLHRALTAAGSAVVQAARQQSAAGEMGTTFVAVLVENGMLTWRTVGDSRLYLFHGDRLRQLNTEHTLASRLRKSVDAGLLSLDEALGHPEARALTSFLGQERVQEVDGGAEPLAPGDRVLLCSDGLHGTLADDEIARRLAALPFGQIAQTLVDDTLARQKPHQDNVSVVVLTVGGVPGTSPEPSVTVLRPIYTPLDEPDTASIVASAMPAAPRSAAPTTPDRPPRRSPWPLAVGLLAVAGVGGYALWKTQTPLPSPRAVADSLRVDSLRADSLRRDSLAHTPSGADTLMAVPARRDSAAGPSSDVWPPPVERPASPPADLTPSLPGR